MAGRGSTIPGVITGLDVLSGEMTDDCSET